MPAATITVVLENPHDAEDHDPNEQRDGDRPGDHDEPVDDDRRFVLAVVVVHVVFGYRPPAKDEERAEARSSNTTGQRFLEHDFFLQVLLRRDA